MNAKHTPGPWVARINATYGFPKKLTPNISINPVVLGQVMPVAIAKVARSCKQSEANARIIGEAPNMFEALVYLEDHIRNECLNTELADKIQSLIDRVNGDEGKEK